MHDLEDTLCGDKCCLICFAICAPCRAGSKIIAFHEGREIKCFSRYHTIACFRASDQVKHAVTSVFLQLAKLDSLKAQLEDLEKKSFQENIWEDQSYAQSLMQELGRLRDQIAEAEALRSMLGDIDAATEVASMEVHLAPSLHFDAYDEKETSKQLDRADCARLQMLLSDSANLCWNQWKAVTQLYCKNWAQSQVVG